MNKCKTCGRRFKLIAKNRYEVKVAPVGFNALSNRTEYYNAFNCPHCGCQNIVGVVEKVRVDEERKEAENE